MGLEFLNGPDMVGDRLGQGEGNPMTIGRRVLGLAAILTGVVCFAFFDQAKFQHPAPGHGQLGDILRLIGWGLLILGGIGINLGRRIAMYAAIVLAADLAVTDFFRAVLPALAHWKIWGVYEDLAEQTAMTMGAVIAWMMLSEGGEAGRARVMRIARVVFGLCLIVFGISHFVYMNLTAPLVPKWLPPSGEFWGYATGVAHIAGGLAIISGIQARLASILITIMYALFGLIVWVPAVIHDVHKQGNWTETAANWLLVAAAWCVMDSLTRSQTALKSD